MDQAIYSMSHRVPRVYLKKKKLPNVKNRKMEPREVDPKVTQRLDLADKD